MVKFVRLVIDKNNTKSDKKNAVMLLICNCEKEKQEEYINHMFECDMKKIKDVKQIQDISKTDYGYNIYTDEYIFLLIEINAFEKLGLTFMFRWN